MADHSRLVSFFHWLNVASLTNDKVTTRRGQATCVEAQPHMDKGRGSAFKEITGWLGSWNTNSRSFGAIVSLLSEARTNSGAARHSPRAAPLDLLTHQHHPFVLLICKVSRHHNWAFGSHFPEKSLTFFVLDGSDEYRSVANFPRGANYRSDSAPIFIPQLRRIPSTNHSRGQRSL